MSLDPQALRVSMEEQRQRQEEETRRAAAQSAAEAGIPTSTADGMMNKHSGSGLVLGRLQVSKFTKILRIAY